MGCRGFQGEGICACLPTWRNANATPPPPPPPRHPQTGPEEDVGTPAGLPAPGDAGSEPAGTYLLAVAAGQAVGGGGEAEVGLAAVDAAAGDGRWAALPPAGPMRPAERGGQIT